MPNRRLMEDINLPYRKGELMDDVTTVKELKAAVIRLTEDNAKLRMQLREARKQSSNTVFSPVVEKALRNALVLYEQFIKENYEACKPNEDEPRRTLTRLHDGLLTTKAWFDAETEPLPFPPEDPQEWARKKMENEDV